MGSGIQPPAMSPVAIYCRENRDGTLQRMLCCGARNPLA
ncbi:hypothetical protein CAter10_0791 [Collimonas arenae]|nr:hypothetical protein CAter10_0791 [Collimonas arenae]